MEQEKLIALVKNAKDGNSAAMEQLLTHAHTTVSYQCRKFMNSPEDAEDMTQEVLMVIYQKLGTLTDPAAFNGWVKRIAATRCMNAVSRTHVELQFSEDEEGNSIIDTIEELDAQKVPEAALDNAETSRMVVELIDALPEAQRICTYLFYYNELSIKEIAKLTAATENTVKSRLNYARKAIKEGVLDHEKKGVKLYGLSPLPFLVYFLRMAAQAEANETAAAACVTNVMAANAVGTVSAVAATTEAAAAATATTVEAAAASVNVAGHAVGFLSRKLIAGILAGAIALGGGTVAAVHLINEHAQSVPAIICQHEWKEANCITPKTCNKCDSTEGEALGHTWEDATCEAAQTCAVCGAMEGEALGHTWADATCEAAQTCADCGATEGEALGHTWADATCEAAQTCADCGTTEGEAMGHVWADATCEAAQTCATCGVTEGEALGHDMAEANYQQPATCKICGHTEGTALTPDAELYGLPVIIPEMGTVYEYRSACNTDTTKMSVGKLTMSGFGVAAPSAELEPIEGYEWYTVSFRIDYRYGEPDNYAYRYGINVRSLYTNYYQSNPWPASETGDGSGNCFTLSYNGEAYPYCVVQHSEHKFTEWYYGLCTYTCTMYWRVPVGYDGMIFGYYDHANPIPAGVHLYEAVDENTLLFRFIPESLSSESSDTEEETTVPEGGQGESEMEAMPPSDNNTATETEHTHNYTTRTVSPTTEAEGYDEHTCSACGASYRDAYTPKIEEDHTGTYKQLVSASSVRPDGTERPAVWEWIPWDCATQGHRCQGEGSHTSVIQEETCCQPEIIKMTCAVIGCDGYETRETRYANHVGDASLITYEPNEFYAVRGSDGYAWTFSDEASVRAKAKQMADAYRNGESRHYVEWIMYSGYDEVYPETFVCKTCGQTLNYKDVKDRVGFTGTRPENPYADRAWRETYTKDNQP